MLWPVAPFFSFWVGATAKQQQTHPKVMTEWKKWATGQSVIRKELTSYKIHTLGDAVFKPLSYLVCLPQSMLILVIIYET